MIVLDTHMRLWWVAGDDAHLSLSERELIEQEDISSVSSISLFEVAWLHHHDRIELPIELDQWFNEALIGSDITLLPITPDCRLLPK